MMGLTTYLITTDLIHRWYKYRRRHNRRLNTNQLSVVTKVANYSTMAPPSHFRLTNVNRVNIKQAVEKNIKRHRRQSFPQTARCSVIDFI